MEHRDKTCGLTAETIKLYKKLFIITERFNWINNSDFYSGHPVGIFT